MRRKFAPSTSKASKPNKPYMTIEKSKMGTPIHGCRVLVQTNKNMIDDPPLLPAVETWHSAMSVSQ